VKTTARHVSNWWSVGHVPNWWSAGQMWPTTAFYVAHEA